ncbi:uncharacterized protein LOC133196138 [Saccostrea echinata]|uniref:uncharacterized protein LOC133196138 n=1 Tax=Saccostrea echinata TaxID=191078 RepID=UPI002A7F428C|nr:uncharacterized protein LOC133196138 [Saccostrea echinata]
MFFTIFVIIFCQGTHLGHSVSEKQFIFVDKNKTWFEAMEFCAEKGGQLSPLDDDNIESLLQGCLKNDSQAFWTSTYSHTTPYLSPIGCVETMEDMDFFALNSSSLVECQYHCRTFPTFAIADNKCACLPKNANFVLAENQQPCNIICDEHMYCGGKDNVNIYSVAQGLSSESNSMLNPVNSLCVSYQCINNSYTFTGRNCDDPSINDVACNDYYSCTFEPGDSCFLVQYKNDNFKWTVDEKTERNSPAQAYEGSYFAYIDDTSYSRGNTSLLVSNTLFQAKKWCLRFWYFSHRADPTASLSVITYNNVTKEVKFQVNITSSDFEEWKYTEQNIWIENDFLLSFLARRGSRGSIFAIDDVTMIEGTCEKSTTKLLQMKGGIKCNFEGGVDICFDQDTTDDFDWSITREGTTATAGTGPSYNIEGNYFSYIEATGPRRNDVARIISKFDLENVNITLSMWYHMYGHSIRTLKVYLRNEIQDERIIFTRTGNEGNAWIFINRTLTIEGKWQLCIEANVPTSNVADIAIDDIRIRINQNALKRNPNAVMILRYKYGMHSYVWETFNKNTTKAFVCEKREKLAMKAQYEQQQNSSMKEQVNIMYMKSDDILMIQNKTSRYINSKNQITQQLTNESDILGGLGLNEIYVNQEHVMFGPQPQSTTNIIDKIEISEDVYDHLHEENNIVTSVQEDTYSHMTDNQYGTHQILCDDTYDHTGGTEGEYGAAKINQDINNTYDRAGFNVTDDVYSFPNKCTCHIETVYNTAAKTTHVSGKEYVYVAKNMSLTEARNFCEEEFGAHLSTLDQTNLRSFLQSCLSDDFQDLWTNTFISSTPYLTIVGCFDIPDNMDFLSLSRPSVYECQSLCSNYSRFAIKMNKCLCIEGSEIFGEQKSASLCNLSCDEETFCGGFDNLNIYNVVQRESVQGMYPLQLESTSCLTQRCVNNSYLFRERNCLDADVSEVSCDGYYSCTFEPGEPCFLIQDKGNTFDWIVETSIKSTRPEKPFDGAYFAYVEDSGYSLNQEARLISSVFPPGYNWCLRFRYYIISDYFMPLKVVIYNVVKRSVGDQFTLPQTEEEWKYKEHDIRMDGDFMIFFETKKQDMMNSNIAIDDVTMIAGNCSEPLTKLLYMKGNMQCNFEGNIDTCFVQDKSDDFDWKIQKGETKSAATGPVSSTEGKYYSYIEASHEAPGDKAVLISKFELTDVSVNISLLYHMYGEYTGRLRLYLKNDNNIETTLFDLSGNQGNSWNIFTNVTKVTKKSKVYIEAKRGQGVDSGIAIDNIQIRIIDENLLRNWKSASQKCTRIMNTYPVAIDQIRNTTCWLDGPERWMGVIRARKMYSGTDDRGRNPTLVRLLRTTNDIISTVWEDFKLNNSRPFACESDKLNSTQKCKAYMKKGNLTFDDFLSGGSSETLMVMVPVLVASLFIFIAVTFGIVILHKRRKDTEKHKDISSLELSTLANTGWHQESLSTEKNTMNPNLLEEDYDHLHEVNNTMTSTKDGVYSHMLDNQYGLQENLSNDTYDHPTGSESEYGAAQPYKIHSTMTSSNDDLYNHMLDNQFGLRQNFSHDTYDYTMGLESEYGASHLNQNLNDTYDRAVLNSIHEDQSLSN